MFLKNTWVLIELVGTRKGQMQSMTPLEDGQVRVEFIVPARGLVGFASTFLTETKGYGIMHHAFSHYGPWAGEIKERQTGSLVAWEEGTATA